MINFNNSLFSSVIAEDFTKHNIQKIAQALSNIIKKAKSTKPVIIAQDNRFLSNLAKIWVIDTLSTNQIKTLVFSTPTSTPVIKYTMDKDNIDYALIITGGDNPSEYNGIRILEKSTPSIIPTVEKLANKNIKIKTKRSNKVDYSSLSTEITCEKEYIKNIIKFIQKDSKENKLRALISTTNIDTQNNFTQLAKHLKIKKLDFSTAVEDIEQLSRETVRGKYNIGIYINNDSTLISIVDEKGIVYNYNTIAPIIYYYINKYCSLEGDIVKTRNTSVIIDSLAQYFNSTCHEVECNNLTLKQKMIDTNSILAVDIQNGILLRDYALTSDAILTTSLLLDAMHKTNKSISRIMQDIRKLTGYISTIFNKTYTIQDKTLLLKQLSKKTPNFSYKPINIVEDNNIIKYEFEDKSSIILNISPSIPLATLTLEFPTEIECERNIKAMDNYLKALNNVKKK